MGTTRTRWAPVAAVVVLGLPVGLLAAGCHGGSGARIDAEVKGIRVSRAQPPGPPVDLQSTRRVSAVAVTCVLTWQPPADDGGSRVVDYVVTTDSTASLATAPAGVDVGTAAVARRTVVPTATIDATADEAASVRIAARNAAGEGPTITGMCPP